MTPVVSALFTAPAAGEPMQSHQTVELVAGRGIPGDRYLLGTGHWSDPQWPDQELTLFDKSVAERLGLPSETFRRNIVISGLPVLDLIGVKFKLGSATLRGVRHCDPCRYLEKLVRPGIVDALEHDGGVRCAIITSGTVSVGDALVV